MEPGSTASNPPVQTSQPLANLLGTLIALLTLTVPMIAIAHFSSDHVSSSNSSEEFSVGQVWQTPPQILKSRE
ncbi:MAG: hypothetical protein KME15_15750 [Drouetiella hepatica Uher 2000/2452]|jgi:hypothetical protein|uniref:Uncharacterized protein n=1 Tax=Drouetiella hepatica Uher 2000/2452 TaxID=904376 RepID=A0A951QDY2_9CYAN|nr:hypothetical protein [Drouetiella hepatica Uher 2000/2452]